MKRTDNNFIPKEITKDIDSGIEIASFGYYDGVLYAKKFNLKQTTKISDLKNGYFIVCCGDVMVYVEESDYPTLKRRLL